MSNLVTSVGGFVGAGVKGLMDLAEGYLHADDFRENEDNIGDDKDEDRLVDGDEPTAKPNSISTTSQAQSIPPSHQNSISSQSTSTSPASAVSMPGGNVSSNLVQTVDVPSGWIHIQSAYLDGKTSQRKVRNFGLRNLVDQEVEVDVDSDLGCQLSFWLGEDERAAPISSASSSVTSSSFNTAGSTSLKLRIPAYSTQTIFLSFQPSPSQALSPTQEDSAFTPRVMPSLSRTQSSDKSGNAMGSNESWPSEDSFSASGESSQSVAGSYKGPSKRNEPVHRSQSIHGSITIRASISEIEVIPAPPPTYQTLTLPFFATVCQSLFTASLIDPTSALATGNQLSSGQLTIDFGSDNVVGQEYHRDILVVNRSEIELIWTTSIVNSRFKDSVWFSLRDLDSENVFGVDRSSQPVPLPALSSRHLRLELRVQEPIVEFDFDFVLANNNQSGNTVSFRAIGGGLAESTDTSLKILSGTTIDYGQIHDGVWAKKLLTCKNAGDRNLDVKFSATEGYEVAFRLAGVAGDDMDDDVEDHVELLDQVIMPPPLATVGSNLSRSSTKERSDRGDNRLGGRSRAAISPANRSRPPSPSSSIGKTSSTHLEHTGSHLAHEISQRILENTSPIAATKSVISDRSSYAREASLPPSRALSRVPSHGSSYRWHTDHTDATESEDDDPEAPFFAGADRFSPQQQQLQLQHTRPERTTQATEMPMEKTIPNQIEELAMRPGTEYRIFVLYRSKRIEGPTAGVLRPSSWKVYIDTSNGKSKSRRTVHCTAESCTSTITISSGKIVDFGEITVGASKSTTLSIQNLGALSARVEIAAISKVLNTNRNIIIIPPLETVEEKLEFFPRRINDHYEKQIFIRNLLNRPNDQLVEIHSKNVDVYNLTLHSHLYRILTPSGSNFLDFGGVVINTPTIRSVQFENLTNAPLMLSLQAGQPEDIELFVKLEDAPSPEKPRLMQGKYHQTPNLERVTSPPNGGGDLKERFMETLRDIEGKNNSKIGGGGSAGDKPSSNTGSQKTTKRAREKSAQNGEEKQSVGAAVAVALKKGGRGRPVQLYGNSVVFKDRHLLESHEYLDLASGPPVAAHRTSPRSKRTALLDSIEQGDKSKLSGQHPKIPKLDFAASAKATGLHSKDPKSTTLGGNSKKIRSPPPPSPKLPAQASLASVIASITGSPASPGNKSPALTGKKSEPKTEMFAASDVAKMSVDELLVAIEQHDLKRSTVTHTTLEEEESFVRRTMALRKELTNLISTGKLVPARSLSVAPKSSKSLVVIMTPNGSIRPHITTRAKRADSRIFIRLQEFDRSLLCTAPGASLERCDLPVRDLVIRSSCVRSVLEVQQSSINFGNCEKGQVKSKTIVIQNKSDTIGLFRLRTSGNIASGDLKLGLGRYGVISAFGRKEFQNFSFTPSLVGNYQETIVVENVLDTTNDQTVQVKANVRKQPTFTVEPSTLDFGYCPPTSLSNGIPKRYFVLTNTSKGERTFVVDWTPSPSASSSGEVFAEIHLSKDDSDAGTALSKAEEEEAEGLLQKLKIAKRKKKLDKVKKYETRLTELGVPFPAGSEEGVEDEDDESATNAAALETEDVQVDGDEDKSETATPTIGGFEPTSSPRQDGRSDTKGKDRDTPKPTEPSTPVGISSPTGSNKVAAMAPSTTNSISASPSSSSPKSRKDKSNATTNTLNIMLQASQKVKVLVDLVYRSVDDYESAMDLAGTIKVHEKKNMDDVVLVSVSARCKEDKQEGDRQAIGLAPAKDGINASDPLQLALMRHCLQLTLQCPVTPTAFCVGSTLFLPSSSPSFVSLWKYFPAFTISDTDPLGFKIESLADKQNQETPPGLILGDGYSRQIPGNTHAEANALTNFHAAYTQLIGSNPDLPPIETILKESECYATMEPCSIRTSGGPSCALELVKAKVRRVYLGVEEPPDFVDCQGVRVMEEGGVEVIRLKGLEEECLKAARRGRE